MSSNISKEVSQILSQMLNNLSNEYPNISKDLTKKNKIFKKNNADKETQKINKIKILHKEQPAIFKELKQKINQEFRDKNTYPKHAKVDWDAQIFELTGYAFGSFGSKYETSESDSID
tara:strand:+ start:63 stop:416 length:354 start_codon:yes stop_codon:yes gene_type:complete